jgi:hypothetical protein
MSWVEVPDAYDGRLGRSTPAILAREGRDKTRQWGYRDHVAATVKLAKDVNLVPTN